MVLKLKILEDQYSIHRFYPDAKIPEKLFKDSFYSISRTIEELSIVCSSKTELNSERVETGWSCIKILGPLDFSMTGILADISLVLAKVKISIFALSTFDTDYILIKSDRIEAAKTALQKAGYIFEN